MTAVGWTQIALFFLVVLALTRPIGAYMFRVFEGKRQPLPTVLGRVERFVYRLCGVDPAREQTWPVYAFSLLAFSVFGVLVTYGVERLQHVLPFNPQHLGPVEPALAFNTAASFTTNTNWQAYTPESTMGYLTQMAGLAWHNFTSAAAGAERPSATSGSTWCAPRSTCCCRSRSCTRCSWSRRACCRTWRPIGSSSRSRAPSRCSPWGRPPRRRRSRCWAPTGAASSTRTARTRSRTRHP